ncbi:hypothetical protein ACJRO7_030636 [Eucalyptus globulus]|uniref:ADP-ribosyl cyclase/cyclic ADP-ribose hydrolase n=1 Tax=Eucalyptus globulus TaxID=34317 RepID=A0ABD3JH85_EUCGL
MASSKRNYHVFLSFRGTDVRNNFLSHLYTDLDRNGIHTFKDSEELRKGEEISPALMMEIEESRVAIIIFSKDYASSRWCLEELATIMECKARKELIVLPVFYKVEPREVRGGRKAYGRAMAKHETKYEKDSETVKRWKKALSDAGNLSGWDFSDGDEAELIQRIIKELSIHLGRTPLHVANYPVGIDSRVEEVISLSQKELDDNDVLMIGLWGPGGIGKTTIAKAIYNAIEREFEKSSFLEQVRENSNKSNGLVGLQEKLLSQILYPRHLTVCSKDDGISLIRERLCSKKILLVLDDVDHLDQLNALVGQDNWFGKGSRIFVTSRDRHLLTSSHCKNCVYEVETLKKDEAQDLFVWHAFPNNKKVEIREDLIDKALHYSSGLPLALEVLGSFLRGRNEPAWESALRKLSNSPDKYIDRVLKISFNGLEENEREIFLDFACFFKGKSIEYIKKLLDGCGFETTIGIEILIDRSLIRNEHGTLQMHDLVQLMGQNIVNQECTDDPGKRSRLCLLEDVQDILCEDTGVNAVKAIVLDLPALKGGRTMISEERTISPDAFRNMKMLRMLILKEVHSSSQDPVYLPNNLRWLEWSNAPFLEFGSGRKKLVGLDIQESQIRQVDGKFKNFECLKYINFRQCKSLLQKIPQLPPNMRTLLAKGCKSLQEFPNLSGLSAECLEVDLSSCRELFRKGANTTDVLSLKELPKLSDADILLSGREMPEWFLHCKDGSISFMVPRDSYDKFVGLALCLVLGPEEGEVGCRIEIFVNGRRVFCQARDIYFLNSDLVWVTYLRRSQLYCMREERKVLRDDWNHFQVHLTAGNGRLKKGGFRLICEQQEDELRIKLQHHRPMKKRTFEESESDEDDWIDTKEEESSSETDDELVKAIDQENERRSLILAEKMIIPSRRDGCSGGHGGCQRLLFRKRLLREQGEIGEPRIACRITRMATSYDISKEAIYRNATSVRIKCSSCMKFDYETLQVIPIIPATRKIKLKRE